MSREYDAQVAELVFGWSHSKLYGRGGIGLGLMDMPDGRMEYIPKFSSDLNDTYQMEDRIWRDGKHVEYGDALAKIVSDLDGAEARIHPPMNWLCVHASPTQRVKAALKVYGE